MSNLPTRQGKEKIGFIYFDVDAFHRLGTSVPSITQTA